MRYYDLSLTLNGALLALTANGFAASTTGLPTFSSRIGNPNGNGTINNPAALGLELDMPVAPYATPQGLQSIRLWGIGIRQIAQSSQLAGAAFTLSAGMKPGLPLATAAAPYAGVIAQGQVFQAFGNWQGTEQTLDLVVQPAALEPSNGIAFSWLPGQTLQAAIFASLAAAFPGYIVSINILPSLVQSQSSASVPAAYTSLSEFADMIYQQSLAIGTQITGNDHYPGVSISISGGVINVYDNNGPASQPTIALAFQDLIGQPTWIDANTVNFKTVLRSDIQLGTQIMFPTGIASPYALTTASAAVPGAPSRSASIFKGTFLVQEVHHFANFRQADADSWVTAFSAVSTGT